jgi:hypothetical protein
MSESPKFEVIDRRKYKADEEHETPQPPAPEPEAATQPVNSSSGPHLVTAEPEPETVTGQADEAEALEELAGEMPPPPTVEESSEQKSAYDASAQRLEDLLRAQNPGMGAPQQIAFEHLVQQFYFSAMMQMGLAAQEGQRPRVDILGARQTIDLLGVLADKTRGNLTDAEDRLLQSVLFEARMAFNEITRMINMQGVQPPPVPPQGKR